MKVVKTIIGVTTIAVLCGCSATTPQAEIYRVEAHRTDVSQVPPQPALTAADIPTQPQPIVVTVDENAVPGTVKDIWVEPMYDTVKVPAQLDPTATYYRPAHKTIVEIRPGRMEQVNYGEPAR